MKKLLVVLLSLGLIVAFSMTASAASSSGPIAKFSGHYYVSGVYENNSGLSDAGRYSGASVFQRWRLRTQLDIADGLSFVMRWDMQEKQWGNTDWRNPTGKSGQDNTNSRPQLVNAGNSSKIQENIEVEQGYLNFKTAAGNFRVGYMPAFSWALDWMNSGSTTAPRAQFTTYVGPVELSVFWDKYFEGDFSGVKAYQTTINADDDRYSAYGIYKWKGGEAGAMASAFVLNSKKPEFAGGYASTYYYIAPYFKAEVGPFYFEGEAEHYWGKWREYEPLMKKADVDFDTWGLYLMGRYNFGPAYVGAQFSYASGDDYEDATKVTRMQISKSSSWNPCLILMNNDESSWHPSRANWDSSGKGNHILYQIFAGFNPVPRLELESSLSYVTVADKGFPGGTADSNKLGTEFDITATYKIFDQLTYMVGFGYLWTGDNWKTNPESQYPLGEVGNDYLLVNKLELIF